MDGFSDRAKLYRIATDPTASRERQIEAAARLFLAEFDRYYGNRPGGGGPAHPSFFDEPYRLLRGLVKESIAVSVLRSRPPLEGL